MLLAVRDVALFIPILFVFLWLARRHHYRGDLTLYTVAILLFSIGQVAQYREQYGPGVETTFPWLETAGPTALISTVEETSEGIRHRYGAEYARFCLHSEITQRKFDRLGYATRPTQCTFTMAAGGNGKIFVGDML